MATTLVVDLIDRVNTILNDITKTRWPEAELLDWFNDAQKAVVARRPDAKVVNASFSCVLGSKQTLPAEALRLVKVISNATAGTAITPIDQRILDEQYRDWHNPASPVTDVKHSIYDDRDPKTFYLFPVPVANHSINLAYSVAPINVSIVDFIADTQTIDVDDIYCNPLMDFMLYRAYSKDAEYTANVNRAGAHMQAFKMALGDKTQADAAVSPNNG